MGIKPFGLNAIFLAYISKGFLFQKNKRGGSIMTLEEIEKVVMEEEKNLQSLLTQLKNGAIHFRHLFFNQEGIIHPCTEQEYQYQFTYFDQKGPVGDFRRNTLEEVAKSIREYQFQPCSVEEFQFIS